MRWADIHGYPHMGLILSLYVKSKIVTIGAHISVISPSLTFVNTDVNMDFHHHEHRFSMDFPQFYHRSSPVFPCSRTGRSKWPCWVPLAVPLWAAPVAASAAQLSGFGGCAPIKIDRKVRLITILMGSKRWWRWWRCLSFWGYEFIKVSIFSWGYTLQVLISVDLMASRWIVTMFIFYALLPTFFQYLWL